MSDDLSFNSNPRSLSRLLCKSLAGIKYDTIFTVRSKADIEV